MREIKFRGLDEKGKWHYGYFWVAAEGTHFIKERIAETHSADFKVRPETVGQYTGLKDKTRTPEHPNGKEIYKGDIVRTDEAGWVAKVKYRRDLFICIDLKGGFSTHCNWEDFEIIGNIYENKELLDA